MRETWPAQKQFSGESRTQSGGFLFFIFFLFFYYFKIMSAEPGSWCAPLKNLLLFQLSQNLPCIDHAIVGRDLDFNFLFFCGPLFSPSSPNVNPGWKPQQIKVMFCLDCFQNKYRVVDNSAFGFWRA